MEEICGKDPLHNSLLLNKQALSKFELSEDEQFVKFLQSDLEYPTDVFIIIS
jgi:hypothetical protein